MVMSDDIIQNLLLGSASHDPRQFQWNNTPISPRCRSNRLIIPACKSPDSCFFPCIYIYNYMPCNIYIHIYIINESELNIYIYICMVKCSTVPVAKRDDPPRLPF